MALLAASPSAARVECTFPSGKTVVLEDEAACHLTACLDTARETREGAGMQKLAGSCPDHAHALSPDELASRIQAECHREDGVAPELRSQALIEEWVQGCLHERGVVAVSGDDGERARREAELDAELEAFVAARKPRRHSMTAAEICAPGVSPERLAQDMAETAAKCPRFARARPAPAVASELLEVCGRLPDPDARETELAWVLAAWVGPCMREAESSAR